MPLETRVALNRFLTDVERRAFRMAQFATGSAEDALDLVQDAMLGFVQRYASRPDGEWGALFYRTLQSRITDWRRRSRVRNRLRVWLGWGDNGEAEDGIQTLPDNSSPNPVQELLRRDAGAAIEQAMRNLPLRQQQAFLLRAWEGLDVRETAFAMECSEGSVKTHYSRAVHALRNLLEDFRP